MALELQEEYGDDLQVIFVESQGADEDEMDSFTLKKKWLGGNAMWTNERPFDLGMSGLPHFGLISPTGELVLAGSSTQLAKPMEEQIAEMVKASKKAPKDMPKSVGKAWVEMNKGSLVKALGMARTAAEKAKDDEERAAAEGLAKAIEARMHGRIDSVEWMLANGYVLEADELLSRLEKSLKGHEEAMKRVGECRDELDSDDMKQELTAAKALAKIEETIFAEGPDEKQVKKLQKLADEFAGTKTGDRARRLAKLATMA